MQIDREIGSVYAMGVSAGTESPVELSVNVWRYTNSTKHGKGMIRLIEIADELFDRYFGEFRSWDRYEGYEKDVSGNERDMRLNAVVKYTVESIKKGLVAEVASGFKSW